MTTKHERWAQYAQAALSSGRTPDQARATAWAMLALELEASESTEDWDGPGYAAGALPELRPLPFSDENLSELRSAMELLKADLGITEGDASYAHCIYGRLERALEAMGVLEKE